MEFKFQGLILILLPSTNSHTLTPAGTLNSVDITPAGNIGTHSLTVAELPAHSHGRGTQDITGGFSSGSQSLMFSGWDAFYKNSNAKGDFYGNSTGLDWNDRGDIYFQASRKWIGTSESKGSGIGHNHTWTGTKNTHNHTFTGTQVTINHMNPYKVAYCFIRTS